MQRSQGTVSHTRRSRAHADRPTGSFAGMQTVMDVTYLKKNAEVDLMTDDIKEEVIVAIGVWRYSLFWSQA
eukprot:1617939-Heterocapsa_arctica.AAC.1